MKISHKNNMSTGDKILCKKSGHFIGPDSSYKIEAGNTYYIFYQSVDIDNIHSFSNIGIREDINFHYTFYHCPEKGNKGKINSNYIWEFFYKGKHEYRSNKLKTILL